MGQDRGGDRRLRHRMVRHPPRVAGCDPAAAGIDLQPDRGTPRESGRATPGPPLDRECRDQHRSRRRGGIAPRAIPPRDRNGAPAPAVAGDRRHPAADLHRRVLRRRSGPSARPRLRHRRFHQPDSGRGWTLDREVPPLRRGPDPQSRGDVRAGLLRPRAHLRSGRRRHGPADRRPRRVDPADCARHPGRCRRRRSGVSLPPGRDRPSVQPPALRRGSHGSRVRPRADCGVDRECPADGTGHTEPSGGVLGVQS